MAGRKDSFSRLTRCLKVGSILSLLTFLFFFLEGIQMSRLTCSIYCRG